jgi:hypothetical protein
MLILWPTFKPVPYNTFNPKYCMGLGSETLWDEIIERGARTRKSNTDNQLAIAYLVYVTTICPENI